MKKQKILVLILIGTTISFIGLTVNNKIQDNKSPDLQTIMRLIFNDIQLINEGIYTHNFSLIERGAAAINEHPPLSNETKAFVKNTLGERMAAFGEYDKLVHNRADSLKNAAINGDMNRVLEEYQIIQQGCVNCHVSFRDEIITARNSLE